MRLVGLPATCMTMAGFLCAGVELVFSFIGAPFVLGVFVGRALALAVFAALGAASTCEVHKPKSTIDEYDTEIANEP